MIRTQSSPRSRSQGYMVVSNLGVYCKSPIKPHAGASYFKHIWGGGGGVIETGAYLRKGLFTLAKTMVWVPQKEPNYKPRGKAKVEEVGGHADENQKQIRTSS